VGQQDIRRHPDWLGNQYASGDRVVVQIQDPIRESQKSYYTRAKVSGRIRSGQYAPAKGWVFLTFSKQIATVPEWGDILLIVQPLEVLHRSGNPGAYDRNALALRRQIHHQTYLDQKAFHILYRKGPPWLGNLVARSREKLLQCLKQFIPGKKEAGLAEALLVGYKQDLDPETVSDYTSTGIVHVIAISGMHLGIIYLLLHTLLQTISGRGLGKGLKAVLVLLGIWSFSLLAGNGPSVLRSAIMYSSLIMGGTMKRNNDSLNALFASAFLLICIEPEMVYDAGFQLSYLAVLGLLLFHQRIRRLWIAPHQWIHQCWNLLSLSLAAQLFTFPVSLFHFHQFPTYFLPANLIAVPFTSLLLIGVLVLLCLCPFAPVAALLGKGLFYAIHSLNLCIHFFANLPRGTWQPLHLTVFQCILFYIVLLLPFFHLLAGTRKKIRIACALIFLIILLRIRSFFQAYIQKQLIIYDIPKSSRMEWHVGRTAYYWNSDTTRDVPSVNRILNSCRQQHRIQKVDRSSYNGAFPFINIGRFRLLHWDGSLNIKGPLDKKPVDLLLLSGRTQCDVATLAHTFLIRQVVIDRSVSRYRARRWTAAFEKEGIPCHNIVDKGAFVMKLP
jgi:competence protein ComEC